MMKRVGLVVVFGALAAVRGADGKQGADALRTSARSRLKRAVRTAGSGSITDGKDAPPPPVLGQFLASHVVADLVATCTAVSVAGSTTTCNGLELNGLTATRTPSVANAICAGVTGKGYNNASGMGSVAAPYIQYGSGGWSVATTGNTSPMSNLTCNK